jgi:hypothetical protein
MVAWTFDMPEEQRASGSREELAEHARAQLYDRPETKGERRRSKVSRHILGGLGALSGDTLATLSLIFGDARPLSPTSALSSPASYPGLLGQLRVMLGLDSDSGEASASDEDESGSGSAEEESLCEQSEEYPSCISDEWQWDGLVL